MTETKRCISCGRKIPNGEEKQYYNYKTGEKVYFCKFCYSVFGKFGTREELKNEEEN